MPGAAQNSICCSKNKEESAQPAWALSDFAFCISLLSGWPSHSNPSCCPLLLGRHEFFRKLRAGAKEVWLHLLHQKLLGFRLPGLQTVLVQQHLGMLGPHAPCVGA